MEIPEVGSWNQVVGQQVLSPIGGDLLGRIWVIATLMFGGGFFLFTFFYLKLFYIMVGRRLLCSYEFRFRLG